VGHPYDDGGGDDSCGHDAHDPCPSREEAEEACHQKGLMQQLYLHILKVVVEEDPAMLVLVELEL
jgi:hypothetical protein